MASVYPWEWGCSNQKCHRALVLPRPLNGSHSERYSCANLTCAPSGRARDLAEIRRDNAAVGISVVHMIERVECVSPDLKAHGFPYTECLSERDVGDPSAGALDERGIRGSRADR